jgi:hypothetical protein
MHSVPRQACIRSLTPTSQSQNKGNFRPCSLSPWFLLALFGEVSFD